MRIRCIPLFFPIPSGSAPVGFLAMWLLEVLRRLAPGPYMEVGRFALWPFWAHKGLGWHCVEFSNPTLHPRILLLHDQRGVSKHNKSLRECAPMGGGRPCVQVPIWGLLGAFGLKQLGQTPVGVCNWVATFAP